MRIQPPEQSNQPPLRRTDQIYPRGHVPPPHQPGIPPMMPPYGHGRPASGMPQESSRIGLLVVAVIALLAFLLIGLSVIGKFLPDGDRGVVSLAMLLGTLIALISIVRLLRNR